MTKLLVRVLFVLSGTVVLGVALSACQAGDAGKTELTVFAASSLTDAFTEIGQAFEAQNPDVRVSFNFAASSALAIQLAEGAAADVFASANQVQMDKVGEVGRIAGEPLIFAANQLVAITQIDSPAGITTLADLSRPGIKLVLVAPGVPARDYAEEMLDKLAADPVYGPDFKAAVLANLVSEETNVRQVVAKIALGEADAAIVYASDVTPDMAGAVWRIEIPDEFNVAASYPMAVVEGAPHPEAAKSFIDFVLSQDGQAILQKWGFGPISAR